MFEELVQMAKNIQRKNPEWRIGQCLFAALGELDSYAAEEVTGTFNDPFHADDLSDWRIQRFAWWIENNGNMISCPIRPPSMTNK